MTPRDVADDSGHVNITKFLREGRSPENIPALPRNISMVKISALQAGGWYC